MKGKGYRMIKIVWFQGKGAHYGYSLKVMLKKQAIFNFDSQASWDMW